MRFQQRALAVVIALLAPAAFAQSAPLEQAEAAGALEEVIVTAQKREELAQETPISMSVYSGEDLAVAGIRDIATLTTVDPSINMTVQNGAAYLAMRGIASTDVTEIGDPAVSIARDGFFANRSFSIFASMYDVSRVEVLKGPQGTLYGRNSTGGVINIITQRPAAEYGGYASIDVGNYQALNLEGAVNIPLGEKVQLRISGMSRDHDGYRDNTPLDIRGDDEDFKSGRIQLAFQPTENFSGWLSAQYDRRDAVGDVAAKGPFGVPGTIPDSKRFPVYVPSSTDLKSTRYRWEFVYDGLPGDVSLTYLGGHDDTSWDHVLDATPAPDFDPLEAFIQSENPTTVNHELRLASATGNRLFWQAGLFYFKEENSPLRSGLNMRSGPFEDLYLIYFGYDIETTSKAAFGQLSYDLTDQLTLSAGARYTKDEKHRTGDADLNLTVASGGFLWRDTTVDPYAPIPVFLCTPACEFFHIVTPGNGDLDDSKPTYHLGLDWKLTDENLLYIKYDTGYKSGGFNSNGSAPSVPYGPEEVDSWEIGTKNRFANNTVQLNAALFYQDYTGYQASQFTPALGGGPGIQNAGNARIIGLEGDLIVSVGANGRFNLNGTWLDTEFKDFLAVNAEGTETVDLSGNELPNAPKLSFATGYEHVFPIGSGDITARIDGKYTSSFNYSFFNFPDTKSPSTTIGNLSVMYAPASRAWSLQGYVRNFTDETVLVLARQNTLANANEYQFAAPRTYGVRFQYNW